MSAGANVLSAGANVLSAGAYITAVLLCNVVLAVAMVPLLQRCYHRHHDASTFILSPLPLPLPLPQPLPLPFPLFLSPLDYILHTVIYTLY